jgi:hypothetical protein
MKKNKGGRPTKYKPEYNQQAKMAAKAGFTEANLAELFGVSIDTITEWKNKHPEFSASLKEGKEEPDDQVEASLFKRATGFRRRVEKLDKDGCVHEIWEELPPDPVSMIFWLKNRRKDKWRDKQEVEHSGNINVIIEDE